MARMGLLDRIFKDKEKPARRGATAPVPPTSVFSEDDEDDDDAEQRPKGLRRELVAVVLRDTMRKHGIPSDWIEYRVLSATSASRGPGFHVVLIVRQGDERLVTYVHAFQKSFRDELVRLEPKAVDSLFSLSWQFEGKPPDVAMPDPSTWASRSAAAGAALVDAAAGAAAQQDEDDDIQKDLQALFAIRDAAMKDPVPAEDSGDHPDFEPTRPGADEDSTQPR